MIKRVFPFLLIFFLIKAFVFSINVSVQSQKEDLEKEVEKIFKQSCSLSGCHRGKNPPKGLNLEPGKFFESLVNVPSEEIPILKRVDPLHPEKSYLLMKIRGDKDIRGERMPLERAALNEEKIKIIEKWILSLKEKEGAEGKRDFQNAAFLGNRLINLPTTQAIEKGEFLFRVSHRFYRTVRSGYDSFYGLDGPAAVLLSFDYGIRDDLSLSLGRTNTYQELELSLRWLIFKEEKKLPLPISAALLVGGSLVTQREPEKETLRSENIKFNLQLSLSYQLSQSFSFLLVPAYSSHTNHWESPPDGTLALGFGGMYILLSGLSLIGEWVPVLTGYKFLANGWGLGLEKKIGGHLFQLFISNSTGLTSDQFIPGGDLRLKDGDFRLGFTIFRGF